MLHDTLSVLGLTKLFSVDQYCKILQLTLFLKLIFDALEFAAVVLFHLVFIIKEETSWLEPGMKYMQVYFIST